MGTFSIEQIITIAVMSLWFLFPLGMFFSILMQEQGERHLAFPFPHVIPSPPNEFKIIEHDEDADYDEDEDFIDENDKLEVDYRIPNYIQDRKNHSDYHQEM